MVCSRSGREFELVWYVVNLSQAGGGGGKLCARKLKNQMPALGLEVSFGSCGSLIYGLGGFYFHPTEDGSNYVMKPDDEEDCTVYFYDASKPFQA